MTDTTTEDKGWKKAVDSADKDTPIITTWAAFKEFDDIGEFLEYASRKDVAVTFAPMQTREERLREMSDHWEDL